MCLRHINLGNEILCADCDQGETSASFSYAQKAKVIHEQVKTSFEGFFGTNWFLPGDIALSNEPRFVSMQDCMDFLMEIIAKKGNGNLSFNDRTYTFYYQVDHSTMEDEYKFSQKAYNHYFPFEKLGYGAGNPYTFYAYTTLAAYANTNSKSRKALIAPSAIIRIVNGEHKFDGEVLYVLMVTWCYTARLDGIVYDFKTESFSLITNILGDTFMNDAYCVAHWPIKWSTKIKQ